MTRSQSQRREGFLHWVLPVMLSLGAITVLLSGRDLARMFLDLQNAGGVPMHPAVPWLQRIVSLLLVVIAVERLANHFALRRQLPSPLLTWTFLSYWTATVAIPAFFGSHPQISHEYLYPVVIGMAGMVATEHERGKVVDAARTALFLFLVASVALVPVDPTLVLDSLYRQGLLPGVPRFGGLAPHAVAMGMFAQVFLLCLWARPFSNAWLNRFAWALGLGVLFFAQSKTSWVAFVVCSLAMLAVRHGQNVWRRIGDPRESAFGIVFCLGVIAVVGALLALILVGNVEATAANFLDTSEGAQLMTMNGREQIWVIAMEEWHANQLFGYGPSLWDGDFRASIGMPNATSAHNQFLDTLARSGSIGAAVLVLYAIVVVVLSIRYARRTGGLSLALMLALALRSVSEVPLILFGYGTEFFTHLLLLVTIASAAAPRVEVVTAPARHNNYKVAS